MTKAELRILYRENRSRLSYQEAEKFSDLVLINFQKIKLPFISHVHTYIASQKLREMDTMPFIHYLAFKNPGLKVLVPKIDIASGEMQHFHFDNKVKLVNNAFGIAEPEAGETFSPVEIDLVLVPLLAFDRKGYRVGYGKGHYDRFLSQCRPDVIKTGVSFFGPQEQIDDINQFDIPLNYCVTPQEVFQF